MLHVNIIMLHVDINESHMNMIMLHVDKIYQACRGGGGGLKIGQLKNFVWG